MNNYEYMEEYFCNGKKPKGLNDNVKIQWKHNGYQATWYPVNDSTTVGQLCWQGQNSSPVGKFRIVDERFLPVGDWYVRGENPPEGTECEVSNCGNKYEWCKILFMGNQLCVVNHKSHSEQHYHLSSVKFRPVPSERELTIGEYTDKIMRDGNCNGDEMFTIEEAVTLMYDYDWRPRERSA